MQQRFSFKKKEKETFEKYARKGVGLALDVRKKRLITFKVWTI
jgi:hypothetical protein